MNQEQKIENVRIKNVQKELESIHYHGDKVRIIYILSALIILVTTPFFREKIPLTGYFSVFCVMVLTIFAGLTNPKSRSIITLNFFISIAAFLVFSHEALESYNSTNSADGFFLTGMLLSVISIFAIYYSSKTLRGNLMNSE